MKMCSFAGCQRPVGPKGARGFCPGHYQQVMSGRPLAPLEPRNVMAPWLLAHVGHEGDDCLTWPFPPASTGYGQIKWHGKMRGAHRIMCELAHGPAPFEKAEATHSCGNGHLRCVNPKHLRWATDKQNKADMLVHGTRVRGEKHGAAKLTSDVVREIRKMHGSLSHGRIAKQFSVNQSTVSKIIRGESWRHI